MSEELTTQQTIGLQPRRGPFRPEQLILTGLPLLSLAALLFCASMPPAYPDTGDPLADLLLADFDRPGMLPWESAELNGLQMGMLWEETTDVHSTQYFASVNERFSDDPRYWQLLYYSARSAAYPKERGDDPMRDRLPALAALHEARQRGVVSGPILRELVNRVAQDARNVEVQEIQALPRPVSGSFEQRWPVDFWRLSEKSFSAEVPAELDMLIQELLVSEPRDASNYYTAAMTYCEAGDYARAWEALRRGNASPTLTPVSSFSPYFAWQVRPEAGVKQRLELAQAMYAGIGSGVNSSPGWIEHKEMVRKLARDAALRNDRAGLQALHDHIIRSAAADREYVLSYLVALTMLSYLRAAVRDFSSQSLSSDEQAGLAALENECNVLKGVFRQMNQHQHSSAYASAQFVTQPGHALSRAEQMQGWWQLALGAASGKDSLMKLYLLDMQHVQAWERDYVARQIMPHWDRLACFDYAECEFTE